MIQNSKLKTQNSLRGFTLIEIMVIIAIVGILAATALVNSGKNADRDVRLEAERLKTFLRSVQNKSLQGEQVSGSSGKICGFGVHYISSNELSVYYVGASETTPYDYCSSTVSKTYPENAYKLDTYYSNNSVTMGNFPDIFFLSPNGVVYSGGSLLGSGTVGFTLSKNGYTQSNLVNLNGSGLVY